MNSTEFESLLESLHACREGWEWASGKSLREAWEQCNRGDWMLWLCEQMIGMDGWPTREEIVLILCDMAETVLPVFENKYPKDDRPRKAIEAARAWANCPAESKNERAKANATANAVDAATNAIYAAYTSANEADAAVKPDDTVHHAAYVAAFTAYAAAHGGHPPQSVHAAVCAVVGCSDKIEGSLKKSADIVRERLTIPLDK